MDIYIAKEHMDKLLLYVKNISDTKPRMYQKSKDRLRDIAETCQTVVEIISEILQEELLDDQFDDDTDINHNTDVLNMVKSMQHELSSLSQFIQYNPSYSITNDASKGVGNTTDKSINFVQPCKCKIDRKSVMLEYKSVLKSMSDQYIEFPQIADLCKLLYNWFDCRFYKSIKTSKDFRYNIRRIPIWICDIVAVYGNYINKSQESEFLHNFNQWLYDISDNGSRFAIPYEIYQFDISTHKNISMTSVIIWDILLDLSMNKLCNLENPEVCLSDDMLYNLCMKHSPHNLDSYKHYKVDPSILTTCKLFRDTSQYGGIRND